MAKNAPSTQEKNWKPPYILSCLHLTGEIIKKKGKNFQKKIQEFFFPFEISKVQFPIEILFDPLEY